MNEILLLCFHILECTLCVKIYANLIKHSKIDKNSDFHKSMDWFLYDNGLRLERVN